MNTQHSITPPPELVRKWATWRNAVDEESFWRRIATEAAQWGADQELEACIEWLQHTYPDGTHVDALWSARRPKPPSLKEQALRELGDAYDTGQIDDTTYDAIRRALEALDD